MSYFSSWLMSMALFVMTNRNKKVCTVKGIAREKHGSGAEVTSVSSFNKDPVYYLGSRLCATYVCLS